MSTRKSRIYVNAATRLVASRLPAEHGAERQVRLSSSKARVRSRRCGSSRLASCVRCLRFYSFLRDAQHAPPPITRGCFFRGSSRLFAVRVGCLACVRVHPRARRDYCPSLVREISHKAVKRKRLTSLARKLSPPLTFIRYTHSSPSASGFFDCRV